MSDDEELRDGSNKRNADVPPGQSGRRSSDTERQNNIKAEQDAKSADGSTTEDGDEDAVSEPEYEDGLDDRTGVEATSAYHRAVSAYDPKELEPQYAEHYIYSDPDIAKYGRL